MFKFRLRNVQMVAKIQTQLNCTRYKNVEAVLTSTLFWTSGAGASNYDPLKVIRKESHRALNF